MNLILEKESITKLIIKYCIPSVFSMWIFATYGIVDGFFISRFIGESALAGINIVLPFINLAFALGIMISVGAGTIIGIKLGEKSYNNANSIYSLGIILLLVFGLLLTLSGIFFSHEIALLMGATPEILNNSSIYLKTLSFFIFTFLLGYGLEIFVRIDGSPSYSILCLIIGAITNILLDYIFIVKLNLGIKGAALATGIGQSSTIFPLIYYLAFKKKKLSFTLNNLNFKNSFQIFSNGSPEFITEIATGLLIITFNLHISKILGEKGIAAFGIIGYFSTFVTMTMIGFSQGLQPIISYNLGAKKFDRIIKLLKKSFIILSSLGIIFYLIINVFSRDIVSLFVQDNISLHKTTSLAITYYSFSYIFIGINILSTSFFTAIEESYKSNILSILRGVILINLFLVFAPKVWGIQGLWSASSLNEFVIFLISLFSIKNFYTHYKI